LSEAKAKTDWSGEGRPPAARATARQATLSDCKADAALASNQNIENNPMQSSIAVANKNEQRREDIDTSGKSAA
jgi:hypothetical protein